MFKLREAGVGGLILKVFLNFLSSHTQRVKVDGVCSSSIDVVCGVPQDSVLGPLLFLLYIADLPRLLQNELVGYADDSTQAALLYWDNFGRRLQGWDLGIQYASQNWDEMLSQSLVVTLLFQICSNIVLLNMKILIYVK